MIFGTVGRLSEEKGHSYLLEAFSKLAAAYPDTKLIIVGDGELRTNLQKLCETLRIRDKVDFAGYQNDVSKYYVSMDIYVSSSLVEHFPVSILEAMSYGKAIVATDVGGTSQLIKDKETGLLVKPASSEELYKAISILAKDSELRNALGAHARRFVKENHSLEKMVASYRKVYEEVLAA